MEEGHLGAAVIMHYNKHLSAPVPLTITGSRWWCWLFINAFHNSYISLGAPATRHCLLQLPPPTITCQHRRRADPYHSHCVLAVTQRLHLFLLQQLDSGAAYTLTASQTTASRVSCVGAYDMSEFVLCSGTGAIFRFHFFTENKQSLQQ